MPNIGPLELIIIALVILALFGYKKLPDAARSIGRSARIFKAETKGLRDDSDTTVTDTTTTARQEPLPPADPTQPRQP